MSEDRATERASGTADHEQKTTIEFTREELSVLVQEATPSTHPGVSERIFDKLQRATAKTESLTQGVEVEFTRAELFKVMLDHQVGSVAVAYAGWLQAHSFVELPRDDLKPLWPALHQSIQSKLERAEDQIIDEKFGLSPRRADGVTAEQGSHMSEDRAFDEWEKGAIERARAEAQNPSPLGTIERREELRQSGMEPDQIDAAIKRESNPGRRQDQTEPANLTLEQTSVILSALAASIADRTRPAPNVEAVERAAYREIARVEKSLYQKQQQAQRQDPSPQQTTAQVAEMIEGQRVKRGLKMGM